MPHAGQGQGPEDARMHVARAGAEQGSLRETELGKLGLRHQVG